MLTDKGVGLELIVSRTVQLHFQLIVLLHGSVEKAEQGGAAGLFMSKKRDCGTAWPSDTSRDYCGTNVCGTAAGPPVHHNFLNLCFTYLLKFCLMFSCCLSFTFVHCLIWWLCCLTRN